jgi:hypothetical protein
MGVTLAGGVIIDDEGVVCVVVGGDVVGLVDVMEGVTAELCVMEGDKVGVGVAIVGVAVMMGVAVAILGSSRASILLPLGKATALVGAKVAARTNATLMNFEYMMIWWIGSAW